MIFKIGETGEHNVMRAGRFYGFLVSFWVMLVALRRRSLWAPFVVPFAPWWHPVRSLRPLVVAFGSFSLPSGSLAVFCMNFASFSIDFKRIFLCLAVTGGTPVLF